MSEDGSHGRDGHNLDVELKLWSQQMLQELGYTQEEIRKIVGGALCSESDYIL